MFKKVLATCAAVIFSAAIALSANLPLQTGPVDAANLRGIINQLIQSINTGVGGLISAQTGAVATPATTTESTLQSYTLPSNTLSTAGQAVRTTCWGLTGANANTKVMKLYFGASVIATASAASNAQNWYLDFIVMRTAAATQAFLGRGVAGTGSLTPVAVVNTAGTDALTAGVLIKCTGTNGAASASDITATGMIVELIK